MRMDFANNNSINDKRRSNGINGAALLFLPDLLH